MSTLIVGLGSKCLDVQHNDKASGTPVILWSNHGGVNQQWELTADGHLVSTSAAGKCLAAEGLHANNGDRIIIENVNGGPNQIWHLHPNGTITSQMNPAKCIDVDHAVDADGSRIILWGTNGGLNQRWNLVAVDAHPFGDGVLISSSSNHAVYLTEAGTRRLIPNPHTFNSSGYSWDNIQYIPDALLNSVPLGNPLPSADSLFAETGEDSIPTLGYMNTTARLTISTGRIDATTRIRAMTWFRGFHGGVGIVPVDIDGFSAVDTEIMKVLWVDGTAIGTSDRTVPWFENIPTDAAAKVEELHIFHTVASEDFQALLEKWLKSGKTIADFIVSVAGVAQAFKGK